MPLLDVRNLSRVYVSGQQRVFALRNISFEVDSGEFMSIMGPSGSGKSTLMNVLGCLDRPTDGDYLINGRSVLELRTGELADLRGGEIGFVFQTFNLIPSLSAQSNVEVPMMYRGHPARVRRTRALEALERVGIEHRADHLPSQLSGGEQQRVALARALSTDPALILADEPTGNLDSETSKSIMQLLSRINESTGVTIIQVTHDDDMATYGERLVSLYDGEITEDEHLNHPTAADGSSEGVTV